MPQYIRAYCPGGTYFFTVVTHERAGFLTSDAARECLRTAWLQVRRERPFGLLSVCLLPDHLHTMWALPDKDRDFSGRWSCIKRSFTQQFRQRGGVEGRLNASRVARREGGFWQRRFWEHLVRDIDDFRRHMDYIHYNPVKHGHVLKPADWPWSTFHHYVGKGFYHPDWGNTEPSHIRHMACVGEVSGTPCAPKQVDQ